MAGAEQRREPLRRSGELLSSHAWGWASQRVTCPEMARVCLSALLGPRNLAEVGLVITHLTDELHILSKEVVFLENPQRCGSVRADPRHENPRGNGPDSSSKSKQCLGSYLTHLVMVNQHSIRAYGLCGWFCNLRWSGCLHISWPIHRCGLHLPEPSHPVKWQPRES